MQKPYFNFHTEIPCNPWESKVNEELQKEDSEILTYEHYDVCEVI